MLQSANNLKFVPSGRLGPSPLILSGNLNSQGASGEDDEVLNKNKKYGLPVLGGFFYPLRKSCARDYVRSMTDV